MALYFIISIESFGKVQNADSTILVKANKIEEVCVNGYSLGYTVSKMESKETDWFIFEDTELNMKKVMFWAQRCEKDDFWAVDAFPFFKTSIEYYDADDKKIKTKEVYLDGSNNTIERTFFSPKLQNEPIVLPVPPAPLPSSDMVDDSNDIPNESSFIDFSKPAV